MRPYFGIVFIALIGALVPSALAQERNQLAISLGVTNISHQTVPGTSFVGNSVAFGEGPSIEATYSRRIKGGEAALFSFEVPVLMDYDEDLNYGINSIPEGFRSYFVTPAARITVFPNLPINPWVSLGGGLGHFSSSSTLEFGGTNPGKTGSTSGVLEFGVGADLRTWRAFSIRAELRDFYSGVPQLNVNTRKGRQSNVFVGVGVVWNLGR